jgi:hypothetical protein
MYVAFIFLFFNYFNFNTESYKVVLHSALLVHLVEHLGVRGERGSTPRRACFIDFFHFLTCEIHLLLNKIHQAPRAGLYSLILSYDYFHGH